MSKQFKGVVNLDVRDSVADWGPFLAEQAPEGAPNVLIVLYDDTGLAAWSPFGGRIEMPTLQKLADNGLLYSQWHTTALCSPTRSCFLTGRNHHQNGFAQIAEGAQGFPGHTGHIPMENAALAEVMREKGWNTFWIGKNHNVPVDEWAMGGSKRNWPLARGFDRFYGFIGGETNQWYPNLVEDNHYVDQPYLPEQGYHLSKDLADKAMGFIRDSKQSNPEKPWFLWFCPGANHAPHHAPQEYIDKYKGKFDDGYEAYREWALPRMIERGVLPEGTELTPLNPLPDGKVVEGDGVRPWDSLSDDEKRLFARMAEVYAGFSEYTDAQVGRIVDYLEESGQLDNTIVLYCADNGASGEGSPNGSVNENRYFNAWPDDIEQNLAMLDQLGSPETYNHYPTGWAAAFSTPFRMFKRYTYQGGVCDPLVISWPAGIEARGEVRDQYHHATDIVPTILECCGIEFPEFVQGYEQTPLPGVSMRYSFDDADAPTAKQVQYYEMMGTRGAVERRLEGRRRARSDDRHRELRQGHLAAVPHRRGPLRGARPRGRAPGQAQAARRPLVRRGREVRRAPARRSQRGRARRRPAGGGDSAGRGLQVLPRHARGAGVLRGEHARALLQDPRAGRDRRPRGGGRDLRTGRALRRALAVRQGPQALVRVQLHRHPARAAARVGGRDRPGPARPGRRVRQGAPRRPPRDARHGQALRRRPGRRGGGAQDAAGHFALCGEGLSIGRDSGDPVSKEYTAQFPFSGGRIVEVEVNIGDDVYLDVEREFAAAMARD